MYGSILQCILNSVAVERELWEKTRNEVLQAWIQDSASKKAASPFVTCHAYPDERVCAVTTILGEMLLTISYIHALSTFTKIISIYVRS